MFFLFQYYDVYSNVYPGSRVAQNLSGGKGTAFAFFKWSICWLSGVATIPAGIYLAGVGIKFAAEEIHECVACIIALPWIAICLFLGSWQMWAYWMMMALWSNAVWNHACDDWGGYALLQGINWKDVSSDLPFAGTATVFLPGGNYTMQLERHERAHDTYYFYNLHSGELTPVYDNITYNAFNHTYTIKNSTSRYLETPNLAFPSLDLELEDNSIPFGGTSDMPLANLIYHNGSTTSHVLSVVNTYHSDCTLLKICGMMEPTGDFEIAMGVVMIHQYLYGVSCTAPDNSNSGVSISVSIGGGGGPD